MLQQRIAQVLQKHTAVICSRIRSQWGNKAAIQGKAEITAETPKILGSIVSQTLNAMGQKAWVAEYGRGSSMDKSSKYFEEYLRNPSVNPWRFYNLSMPIMGRSAGEYRDLDGNTHVSSGKMAGLDLERDGDPRFRPMLPMHIIEREIDLEYPEIVLEVNKVVSEYVNEQLRQL